MYSVDQVITTRCTFYSEEAIVDPHLVQLVVTDPSPATHTCIYNGSGDYTVRKVSAGIYEADIPLSIVGIWRYRWEADSGIDAKISSTRSVRVASSGLGA